MTCPTAILLIVVSTAMACTEKDEPAEGPTPEAEPEETAPPEPGPAATLMHEHFLAAREVRQAIIGDDLQAAGDSMGQLAEAYPATDVLPAEVRPALDALVRDAQAFGDETELAEASDAFARVIVHCGECHEEAERGPSFAAPPLPEGSAPSIQMNRHRWGIERMWEGLVARDAELYGDGASVLAEVTLAPNADDDGVDRTIEIVNREAAAAVDARDWAGRATHYGRILSTCAGCHRAMGVGDFARAAGDSERPVGP
jgi:cytochrome c553